MPLRVAVVGTGNIGRIHATQYGASERAQLVAVCDVVREKADAFAERFGAKPYYSLPELLKAERPDVLSVTTAGPENGGHHYEPVMQALDAGVNVLCEKPLSNEIERAREMVRAAQARNVYLGVNLNHRFAPAAERAKKWVDDGVLGELLLCNMALWIRNPNESSPWFHLRALHPHSIDVMRFFMGDVAKVQAFMKKASHRAIWSNTSINLQFASGALGHLVGSYDMTTRHPFERCEVGGSKARFVIENVNDRVTLYPHDSDETTVVQSSIMGAFTRFEDTFKARINRFLEQVEAKVPPRELEGSGAEALAAQEVIEAAVRSWETGEVIEVPKAALAR